LGNRADGYTAWDYLTAVCRLGFSYFVLVLHGKAELVRHVMKKVDKMLCRAGELLYILTDETILRQVLVRFG
jgi:hypothetical protein